MIYIYKINKKGFFQTVEKTLPEYEFIDNIQWNRKNADVFIRIKVILE